MIRIGAKDIIFSIFGSILAVSIFLYLYPMIDPNIEGVSRFVDDMLKGIDYMAYLIKSGVSYYVPISGIESVITTYIPGGTTTTPPPNIVGNFVEFLVVILSILAIIFAIEYGILVRARDALGIFFSLNIAIAARAYQNAFHGVDTTFFLVIQVAWLELALVLSYYKELYLARKKRKETTLMQRKTLELVRGREQTPEVLRRYEPLIATYFAEFHDRLMSGENPFADLNKLNSYLEELRTRNPFIYNSLTPLHHRSSRTDILTVLEIVIRIIAVIALVLFLYRGVLEMYKISLPPIYGASIELEQPEIFIIPLTFVLLWLVIAAKIIGKLAKK